MMSHEACPDTCASSEAESLRASDMSRHALRHDVTGHVGDDSSGSMKQYLWKGDRCDLIEGHALFTV
jgi:hypothetical protein